MSQQAASAGGGLMGALQHLQRMDQKLEQQRQQQQTAQLQHTTATSQPAAATANVPAAPPATRRLGNGQIRRLSAGWRPASRPWRVWWRRPTRPWWWRRRRQRPWQRQLFRRRSRRWPGQRPGRAGRDDHQGSPAKRHRGGGHVHGQARPNPPLGPNGERIWSKAPGVYVVDGEDAFFKETFLRDPWAALESQHQQHQQQPSAVPAPAAVL
ncbi:hypothetical protein BC831DRAFT_493065, partial [Entophlyctis helioformis]